MSAEGWGWLFADVNNWHYFRNQRSLCGKFLKITSEGLDQGNDESLDNCKQCVQLLKKEKADVAK